MLSFEVRWKHFRGLSDTNWLRIRPITIILGGNASGKTSVIAPLLVLKQTYESQDTSQCLKTRGRLFNAGAFEDMAFQRDIKKDMTLSIRFQPLAVQGPAKRSSNHPAKPPAIGESPPGCLELVFGHQAGVNDPVLKIFTIQDVLGRKMLQRKLQVSGNYTLVGVGSTVKQRNLADAIRTARPEGFLFSPQDAFRAVQQSLEKLEKKRASPTANLMINLERPLNLYISALNYTVGRISQILGRTAYIGPLRARPRRIYELSGETPFSVGPDGEYAPEIIFRAKEPSFLASVNDWVAKFEFGLKLEKTSLTNSAFNITLRRGTNTPSVNLADTGFGLSQVLPLIVQGLYSKKGGLIIAEQPEIHLNPRLQSVLAELFCSISSRDVSILIETHSEHLLLSLRRLIAQGKLKQQDLGIFFTERIGDVSTIREIAIDKLGHIESSEWPKGFFEDSLRESLALASAQSRA